MNSRVYYVAENTSDQDIKLDLVLDNGELVEDVFAAHEVVSGLTYEAMRMLVCLDRYCVIKTQREEETIKPTIKPAWLSEGF